MPGRENSLNIGSDVRKSVAYTVQSRGDQLDEEK